MVKSDGGNSKFYTAENNKYNKYNNKWGGGCFLLFIELNL